MTAPIFFPRNIFLLENHWNKHDQKQTLRYLHNIFWHINWSEKMELKKINKISHQKDARLPVILYHNLLLKTLCKKIIQNYGCVFQNCTLMVSATPVSYLIIFLKRESLLVFFQWLILQQGQHKDDNLLRWTFHKFDKNFKVYFFQRNRISSASPVCLDQPSCMKDD